MTLFPTSNRCQRHSTVPGKEVAMQLDPPASGGEARRRFRRVLVWSGLAVLAALALALAMVIASLALELGSQPAPPPTPPMQLGPPVGHPMAQ
jgi:hypothetical protein